MDLSLDEIIQQKKAKGIAVSPSEAKAAAAAPRKLYANMSLKNGVALSIFPHFFIFSILALRKMVNQCEKL